MAYNSKGVEYMRGRGAINDETDIFFYFGSTFEDGGKKVCYGVYKLWEMNKHITKSMENLVSAMIQNGNLWM